MTGDEILSGYIYLSMFMFTYVDVVLEVDFMKFQNVLLMFIYVHFCVQVD